MCTVVVFVLARIGNISVMTQVVMLPQENTSNPVQLFEKPH